MDWKRDPFEEYIKASEPGKSSKGYAWSTAIGLQAVDGLKPSQYLIDTAIRNIEGEITVADVKGLLDSYYASKPGTTKLDSRTEEADKVSARITELLMEQSFSFTAGEYLSIHRRLFCDVYSHAGKIRDYNITKKEWVLDGATVLYGSATELMATLEYDINQEKNFSYKDLSMDEIIHHLAIFISRLWQIHVFGEGNTRTTAVFFIKYLRTLGLDATNDIFAENAWYFRNTLVRANYTDLKKGIHETTEYLEKFLRNLLLEEKHPLHNRDLHISGSLNNQKPNIEDTKPNIEDQKPDIQFEAYISKKLSAHSSKTKAHAILLYQSCGNEIFGRSTVLAVLGIKNTAASELLKKLLLAGLIEQVPGHGKGRYRFVVF